MAKRRTKKQCDEIYWRIHNDKKAGRLKNLTISEVARFYDLTYPLAKTWLERIDTGQDRFGNSVLINNNGHPFVSDNGLRASKITVYPVPSDWKVIKIASKKNILTGKSIKDDYDDCSPELRLILWKLLSFEISQLESGNFYYPQHHVPGEVTGQSMIFKVSPGAYEIWSQIEKSGTTSKSNWALDMVINPFFLHIK